MRLSCSQMKNGNNSNIDVGELQPLRIQCQSKSWRLSRKYACCGAVKLFGGTPVFASRCLPPTNSTQGDMCLRTWDKFFKHHKPLRNGNINVRIRGDGDTCLGVMWYLFFLQEQEHQSSPWWGDTCCVRNVMRPMHKIPRHYTLQKLLAARFCSLSFACEAFCVYKLNSNYTTGWQSTKFVHLREGWHFDMAVNT